MLENNFRISALNKYFLMLRANLPDKFLLFYIPPFINQLIPLFLVPILTLYLSNEDYGRLSMVSVISSMFTPFFIWGCNSLIQVEFNKNQLDQFRVKFSSWLYLIIFLVIFLGALLFPLNRYISEILNVEIKFIYFAFCISLLNIFPVLGRSFLIISKQITKFIALELFIIVANATLSFLFVAYYDLEVIGRLFGILIGLGVGSCLSLYFLRSYINFVEFTKNEFFDLFKFGIGILPNTLLTQLNRNLDKFIVISILGSNIAGIYYLAFQFSSILLEIFFVFNMAWTPHLITELKEKKYKNYKDLVRSIFLVSIVFLIIYIIFLWGINIIFPLIVDEKFYPALDIIPIYSVGFLFLGFYMLISGIIFHSKKTYYLSVTNIITTIIIIPMYYFFVKDFGLFGAAATFVIYSFIIFLVTSVLTLKILRKV